MIFACLFSICPTTGNWIRCTTGVPHDWMGYKSFEQMAVGRALDWSIGLVVGLRLDLGYLLVLDCRWFWIIVVVCLYYHLTDFTLHLLFLFTTLTFTTRFIII